MVLYHSYSIHSGLDISLGFSFAMSYFLNWSFGLQIPIVFLLQS